MVTLQGCRMPPLRGKFRPPRVQEICDSIKESAYYGRPTFLNLNSNTMDTFDLNVNGEKHQVEAEADTPLLWILRDHLNLSGTKFGCGVAQCGACTIHLDGKPVRSCVFPVSAVAGRALTTIEGLSKDDSHPLQKAWVEEQVPQCGYCQSGQIMQAATLLKDNPKPSREEIIEHMDGNLCRCGTYGRILKAIERAANEA